MDSAFVALKDKFKPPLTIEKDDLKVENKRVERYTLMDDIKKLVVDAFKTKNSVAEVEKHVSDALSQSEDGKWVCFLWFDGQKNGTYWQHQGVKFALTKEDVTANLSIAQININRDKNNSSPAAVIA